MIYLNHQEKGNKNKMEMTRHCAIDRQKRIDFITNTIGMGEVIFETEEPTRLANKPNTIVKISNTGIATICEKGTDRVITLKIARPNQLRKWFGENEVPKNLIKLAIYHKKMGWNEL